MSLWPRISCDDRGEITRLLNQALARIARGGFDDYGHELAWRRWVAGLEAERTAWRKASGETEWTPA